MKTTSLNRKVKWILANPVDEINEDDDLSPWDKLELEKENNKALSQIPEFVRNSMIHFPRRNIWIGVCDWGITKRDFINICNKAKGLEIIKFPGTYTFVMAAGYIFNEEEVKKLVLKVLKAKPVSVSSK